MTAEMKLLFIENYRRFSFLLLGFIIQLQGCSVHYGAEIQWSSKSQILRSEASQVKMRSIQTRVYDTTDKEKIMYDVISVMQDLYFDIDVLDLDLGVISGKKMYQSGNGWANSPTYYNYKTDSLAIFSTNFRTYGPFHYRNDLTRLTVTIRPRGKTQLMARASFQYNIRAVEDPEVYQHFFKQLGQSQFLSSHIEENR
ncbi:MAG: hypothetical protein ACU833_15480 [Gammaproteobacteria bacterium]